MKKIILLFAVSFWYFLASGQTSAYLRNKNYDAVYSESAKRPLWVYYELSKSQLEGTNPVLRTKYPFAGDPKVSHTQLGRDYYKSGYDRGHMMPAADNSYDDQGMKECNYYANIMPQAPELNRGPWKTEENHERFLAKEGKKLTVYCGGYRSLGPIGKDGVDVPALCWKIVIVQDIVTHIADTLAYLFPNDNDYKGTSTKRYEISYKELQAGLPFDIEDMTALHNIKDPVEQAKYMVAKSREKVNKMLTEKMLTREKVLEKYKTKFTDPKDFEKQFSNAGIDLPKGYTIDGYIGQTYDDSQTKINQATTQYFNDLSTTATGFGSILDQFSTGESVIGVFSKAGICPCCGLPLSFPICGCRLLVE